MDNIYKKIYEDSKLLLSGDVYNDEETLKRESYDYSPLEVMPRLAIFPKNSLDIQKIVTYIKKQKRNNKDISLTPRSAGIDETGGPLNESIILDTGKYMNNLITLDSDSAVVQPGLRYADFDKVTKQHGYFLPSYPASRDLCSVGGMVGNNSGGPKTLMYGKTEQYIKQLKVILSDGHEYILEALNKTQLHQKMKLLTFEGEIYRRMFDLIDKNYDEIQKAKPDVTKNSAGYFLWNVWDKKTFDLTKLFVGSQGTLGVTTEITFGLVKNKKFRKMLIVFLDDVKLLSDIAQNINNLQPEELEMYDKSTFKMILEHFPSYVKTLKENVFLFGFQFFPEFIKLIENRDIPQYFILAKFAGNSGEEVNKMVDKAQKVIEKYKLTTYKVKDMEKYNEVRHKTFYFFQKQLNGKQEVTFFDDLTVQVKYLSDFLPKLRNIVEKYTTDYFIVSHVGNGDIHMVPFFDLSDPETKTILNTLSHEAHDLVFKYKGTSTGEHNEGLIRSPFTKQMYGEKIYKFFKQTKNIFDPENIFNPGKKVNDKGLMYALNHLSPDSYKHKVKSI